MDWNDFFGHIGYIFIVVGMLLLGQKNIWGWIVRLIGEFIWTGVGLAMGMSSIYVWGAIFLLIDIRGFLRWRKENKAS